jgi:hypothetical protein
MHPGFSSHTISERIKQIDCTIRVTNGNESIILAITNTIDTL